jgi:hypothetical protein
MPGRLQQPCPMVAATAGFDRNHRRRRFSKYTTISLRRSFLRRTGAFAAFIL